MIAAERTRVASLGPLRALGPALIDAWLTGKGTEIHGVEPGGLCGVPRIHAELRLEHEARGLS